MCPGRAFMGLGGLPAAVWSEECDGRVGSVFVDAGTDFALFQEHKSKDFRRDAPLRFLSFVLCLVPHPPCSVLALHTVHAAANAYTRMQKHARTAFVGGTCSHAFLPWLARSTPHAAYNVVV
jgi:hypothetical protein